MAGVKGIVLPKIRSSRPHCPNGLCGHAGRRHLLTLADEWVCATERCRCGKDPGQPVGVEQVRVRR